MTDVRIRLLSNEVIDRIAAGEVIERPASVVKELVENAVDAGGRAIRVDVEGGGLELIAVADDGRGMSAADARLCLQRHATSKLVAAEDLFAIRTLGFRGEALSSIAAVSRLVLTTRRPEDPVGVRIEAEGGELLQVAEAGCAAGTVVEVRDLFFNTPARRRFMRSPATEQAHVVDAALRVVIGARQGGVVVRAGRRRLVDLPEEATVERRVLEALGRRVEEVFPVDGELDGVRVSGFVAPPGVDRADARGLWFFVNGRFVRDRMLQRAVMEGFRSMVERGRYPIAVVYVDLNPEAVDVNVHPQKLEVRFGDSTTVFRAISRAVAGVLAGSPWVQDRRRAGVEQALGRFLDGHGAGHVAAARGGYRPGSAPPSPEHGASAAEVAAWPSSEHRAAGTDDAPGDSTRASGSNAAPWPPPERGDPDEPPRADAGVAAWRSPRPSGDLAPGEAGGQQELPGAEPGGFFSSLRPVGQVLSLYLVCEGRGELVLIDQHAAHERVAFQRLRGQAAARGIERQPLLFPEIIETPGRMERLLEERAASLLAYGFEVEPVGPGRFAVRAIPAALSGAHAAALVADLVDELELIEERAAGITAQDARDRVLSRCACHTAVRSGDRLHAEEIRALLRELDQVDFGANCPHGRPVYRRLPKGELDHMFHR